jgi:protein phosphatase
MLDVQFTFQTGASTHQGRVRNHNEDAFLTRPASGLWVVSDGMGGHKAGDFASRMIVEKTNWIGIPQSAHDLKERFLDRVAQAHEEIRQQSERMGGATIGATMVSLLIFGPHFACIWSGDSRIYLYRDAALRQMTQDHTEVNELLRSGTITEEQARAWPRKNVITRAIGVFDTPEVEEKYGTLRRDDTFLLCSDGLTGHVSDDEIAAHLAEADAQEACDRLIELTLSRGARDNVTVVVVRCIPRDADGSDDERTRPGIPLAGVDNGIAED